MTTSVGLSARETAASVRAAMMRFGASTFRRADGEAYVIAEVSDKCLPPLAATLETEAALTLRERRMLRLASAPMLECLSPLGPERGACALFLALPEMHAT